MRSEFINGQLLDFTCVETLFGDDANSDSRSAYELTVLPLGEILEGLLVIMINVQRSIDTSMIIGCLNGLVFRDVSADELGLRDSCDLFPIA